MPGDGYVATNVETELLTYELKIHFATMVFYEKQSYFNGEHINPITKLVMLPYRY